MNINFLVYLFPAWHLKMAIVKLDKLPRRTSSMTIFSIQENVKKCRKVGSKKGPVSLPKICPVILRQFFKILLSLLKTRSYLAVFYTLFSISERVNELRVRLRNFSGIFAHIMHVPDHYLKSRITVLPCFIFRSRVALKEDLTHKETQTSTKAVRGLTFSLWQTLRTKTGYAGKDSSNIWYA